jgi:hypothetical protein
MNNPAVEKEVERTLGALENIQRAPVPPFFYTRLKARMETEHSGVRTPAFRLSVRSSFAALAGALLLLFNMYSIWHSTEQSHAASNETRLSSFADVYALTDDGY